MTEWDGRGLPPVAAARVARAASSGVRSSLLSVPDSASIESVGLTAVGEVMGGIVEHIGWQGYRGCGLYGGWSSGPQQTVPSQARSWSAYRPYADAIRRGYATAMSRLVMEAKALGADGVVGIQLKMSHLDDQSREFTALGTAVRAQSRARPRAPFTTDLSGADVAKLLQAGWAPAALLVGFEVSIRHDDWRYRPQLSLWNQQFEYPGYTELTQRSRQFVRIDVQQQVARLGADGFISSAMGLHIWAIEPSDNHRDHVAEAFMRGTAIARVAPGHRLASSRTTRTLTVLPLR